jgi:hypothetical protein
MFGSDQMRWPEKIGEGIEAIELAPFLTEDQKQDIFYRNAARFLRLEQTGESQRSNSSRLSYRALLCPGSHRYPSVASILFLNVSKASRADERTRRSTKYRRSPEKNPSRPSTAVQLTYTR